MRNQVSSTPTPSVRVFEYIAELDAFILTEEFRHRSDRLGLTEWHAAVWVGRLFFADNDFGEHWFDNWDERERLETKAQELGIDSGDLMIVVPDRFQDGRDGPCHTTEIRRRFWTDVLRSLELSYELLFEQARRYNAHARDREWLRDEYLPDLEERIAEIEREVAGWTGEP